MSSNLITSEVLLQHLYLVNDKIIGDNFHEVVLNNKTDILKMFKEVKAI